jgi:transposase
MATKTGNGYTGEQKATILKAAKETSVAQAAKDHGVAEGTIYTWRKGGAKAGKKRQAKKRRSKAARSSNGHTPAPRSFRVEVHASGELDHVEQQLTEALQSVQKMQAAFRTVFGGA